MFTILVCIFGFEIIQYIEINVFFWKHEWNVSK